MLLPGCQPDPTPFYPIADLFVLSSSFEGFGTVLVEAMAAGLPVISTDRPGGFADILACGRFGTLVPTGDAQAFAKAIERAISRPVDRDRLHRRAADFVPVRIAARSLDILFPARAKPASPS